MRSERGRQKAPLSFPLKTSAYDLFISACDKRLPPLLAAEGAHPGEYRVVPTCHAVRGV